MQHRGRALAAVVVAALAIVLLLAQTVLAQDVAPDAAPSTGVTPDPVPGAAAPAPSPAVQPSRTATPVTPTPRARPTTTVVRPTTTAAGPRPSVTPQVTRTRTRPARRHRAASSHHPAPIRLPVVRPPSWAVHVPALPVAARTASNPDRTRLAGAGIALLLLALASGALLTLLARGERLRPRA